MNRLRIYFPCQHSQLDRFKLPRQLLLWLIYYNEVKECSTVDFVSFSNMYFFRKRLPDHERAGEWHIQFSSCNAASGDISVLHVLDFHESVCHNLTGSLCPATPSPSSLLDTGERFTSIYTLNWFGWYSLSLPWSRCWRYWCSPL